DEEVEDLSVDEEGEEEKPQTPEPKEAEAPAPKRRGRKPKGAKEPKAEEPAPKTEAKEESTATTTTVLADQQQAAVTSAGVPAPLVVEGTIRRVRVLRARGPDTSQLEWVLSLLAGVDVGWRGGGKVRRRQDRTPERDIKTKGAPLFIRMARREREAVPDAC